MTAAFMVCMTFPSMAGQWHQEGDDWKYVKDDQTLVKQEWFQEMDGRWYYFDETGSMVTNSITPDGYVAGADGVYIPGMGSDRDAVVTPWNYQRMLGHGMDVDWSKVKAGRDSYQAKVVEDFRQAGVDHVRIRVKDDWSQELLSSVEQQIDDCLGAGLIPVLAYQADTFKNDPSQANINQVADWWRFAAEQFQEKSHLLSFDLMIESSDVLNKQPERLNQMIEQTVSAIRQTNPDRIIMMSPRLRSDPTYLSELKIPTAANGYMMAEWHFYAAGPSKTNDKKLWTTGTDSEKQMILNKIQYALNWQQQTGIPTWVGAWMPGDYNDGNSYSISEQMVFAAFMCDSLDAVGIPFAVNSDTKFYDRESGQWIENMKPLRELIYR